MMTGMDYEGYFREIARVEKEMVDLYKNMIPLLKDNKWKDTVNQIIGEEKKHFKIATDLLELLGYE